jgi:hypothetical protein
MVRPTISLDKLKWDVLVTNRQSITRDLPPDQEAVDLGADIGDLF